MLKPIEYKHLRHGLKVIFNAAITTSNNWIADEVALAPIRHSNMVGLRYYGVRFGVKLYHDNKVTRTYLLLKQINITEQNNE
jgi:hypothetical protein